MKRRSFLSLALAPLATPFLRRKYQWTCKVDLMKIRKAPCVDCGEVKESPVPVKDGWAPLCDDCTVKHAVGHYTKLFADGTSYDNPYRTYQSLLPQYRPGYKGEVRNFVREALDTLE